MKADEILIAESERSIGVQHQGAWDSMVEPFFVKKQAELYAAFVSTSVEKQDHLKLIHMQSKALESLKDNFMHFIDTGKMAQHTLNLNEEKNDD